jgi:hypothetical protein
MTRELYINGKDAWTEWGVSMGDGFVDAIDAFVPMKEYIENDSRLEHGKRVLVTTPRLASRELTLHFTIKGVSESDFRSKRRAFENELRKGRVTVMVPALNDEVYHLLYLGRNVSYALNRSRTFAAISAKFEEPNPSDRTLHANP